MNQAFKNVDEYINSFQPSTQKKLNELRRAISKAAPGAVEATKYGMPTFILNGNLIHFAAFKNHIGLYPTPSATGAFKEELSIYKSGKGSIQFPINKPLPIELVVRIVKFRVAENMNKKKTK